MHNVDDINTPYDNHFKEKTLIIIDYWNQGVIHFFDHAKNLHVAHIIQFCKNKMYNKTNTNKITY